jgi:methylmalonyl-CoA/ethylmalonyl-CoA epimerase
MTSPFRRLHHICIVVHDLDAAIAYYESLGIGPWQQYPPLSQYTDLHVPEPEAFGQLKYCYADLDNVQIQLCEPPRLNCPQRRFLDSRGEGVFHIGFESDLNTATAQAQASGLEVLMSGRRENQTGFVFFDTLERAGVVWACRQTIPPQSQ